MAWIARRRSNQGAADAHQRAAERASHRSREALRRFGQLATPIACRGPVDRPTRQSQCTHTSYDNTDQLKTATYDTTQDDEFYIYDENGNRTNPGYVTDENNRLWSDGANNYEYDNEGNRILRTNASTGVVTEYDLDHHNRLVKVTETAGGATQIVEYDYDLFGRRVAKHIDTDGDGIFDEESYYIYDGERHERGNAGDHIVLAFDGDGEVTNRYLHGPIVDQIFADEQVTSVTAIPDGNEV